MHKELEGQTKTSLLQVAANAARQAEHSALPVRTTEEFRELVMSAAKLCGWDVKPTQVNVGVGVQVATVDTATAEAERMRSIERLQAQLERIREPGAHALPAKEAAIVEEDEQQPASADELRQQPPFAEVPAKAPPEPSTPAPQLPKLPGYIASWQPDQHQADEGGGNDWGSRAGL